MYHIVGQQQTEVDFWKNKCDWVDKVVFSKMHQISMESQQKHRIALQGG